MQTIDHNDIHQYVHIRIGLFTTIYVVDHEPGKIGIRTRRQHMKNDFAKALRIAMQLKIDHSVEWIKVSNNSNQIASIENDDDALDALFKSLAW
jgi:predicted acetyltransferase